jgi:hypothetical protein
MRTFLRGQSHHGLPTCGLIVGAHCLQSLLLHKFCTMRTGIFFHCGKVLRREKRTSMLTDLSLTFLQAAYPPLRSVFPNWTGLKNGEN